MKETSPIQDLVASMNIDVKDSEVPQEFVMRDNANAKVEPFTPIVSELNEDDRYCAYLAGLIPKQYMHATFDIDKVQQNIKDMLSNKGYKVSGFKEYSNTLLGILSILRTGTIPDCSYIIGAPNSFGKTSFTSECIMTMHKLSMRAVPFVSLSELNEIMVLNDRAFEDVLKLKEYNNTDGERSLYVSSAAPEITKMPKNIVGRYSWSEYLNSDCLFCFLTSTAARTVESRILYHLIQIRSAKGLPTVCFISSSLDPYTGDKLLNEYYWKEMLSYNDEVNMLDRMKHISCFKKKLTLLDNQ